MPIFEFGCRTCRRKTTALVVVRAWIGEVRCTHCGGADLVKLVSRFAMPKSDGTRLDALADPSADARDTPVDDAAVLRQAEEERREAEEARREAAAPIDIRDSSTVSAGIDKAVEAAVGAIPFIYLET